MDLTDEQTAMSKMIREHITARNNRQVLVCHGVAGTGKTTVLTSVAADFGDAKLCAYTGKAASVLRAKSGLKAQTVHSLFYKLKEKEVDENGKRVLVFERVHSDGALQGMIILLDECSMIDRQTASDLIRSGAKIVAVGDPGQLPPVQGAAFFNDAHITLKEIHRQALDSAVIRQAHAMRETGRYQNDGPDFQVVRKATDEQMMAADMILCWRNVTRRKINQRMRSLLSYNLPYPMAGEQVLCLKNARDFGIFNGVTYKLARNFEPGDHAIQLMIDGNRVTVPDCIFVDGGTVDDYDDDDFVSAFDYGCCLTVHKSQGSEWGKVLLIDENHKYDRQKWAYTGITRASKSIIVQG